MAHQHMRTIDDRGTATDAPLLHGADGNYQALEPARAYILKGAQDEEIRTLALRITANVKGHDVEGELDALYRFCRDEIRYRSDPRGQERVQSARFTLKTRVGDCLDKVILFCALAGSLGHVTRFVLLMQRQRKDGAYGHVFAEGRTAAGWKSYDPTPEEANAGWRGTGIQTQTVAIYTPAEQLQLAGWLSTLVGVGGMIAAPFTGGASLYITAATGAASGLIGMKEAKGAQEKQAGALFETEAAKLAALLRQFSEKPTLTAQEYDQAAQGFAQLEQFAQDASAVKYIAQKWPSDAYAPSFRRQLAALKARTVNASGASAAGGASVSPLLLVGGGLAALYFLSR